MQKIITKTTLHNQNSDLQYWKTQTPQQRLAALEEIRQEYHQWKYNAEPRLQRVYRIIKQTRR